MTTEFDYIIAGGGSAGCVLAARLCENPDLRVLLVEAGGKGGGLRSRMPAAIGMLPGTKRYDWQYLSQPQPGLNGRQIKYPRGKGLGGSSLINGMIYMRGSPRDFDRWAENGLHGWSYDDVLPYFRRAAAAPHRSNQKYHSDLGAIRLSPAQSPDPLSRLFVDACRASSVGHAVDFNGARPAGGGFMDFTISNGTRQDAYASYLPKRPAGLTILTGTRVLKVLLEKRRATGLLTTRGAFHARREVILSLGAFETPKMLMLSGIGPATHLNAQGIEVVRNLPGVGQSLLDHPNVPMQFSLLDPNLSTARYQRLDRAMWAGLRWLLTRQGPGASAPWSAVMFHAQADRDLPELEVFFSAAAYAPATGAGSSIITNGHSVTPGFQFDINLMRPRSHGSVSLQSNDPFAPPVIDPAYFSNVDDCDALISGIRFLRGFVAEQTMRTVAGPEQFPGAHITSNSDLREAIRTRATTGHHPACTARMGAPEDPMAVLDGQFRVRGIDALRVVDASAMPDMITGNIHATVTMMAERAADALRS
ncbi:GMC family oxidoreductase N-terminal domain-containing protein [Roseovarius aestuarii]|nr:GMC family oxidoreductase N-terminal domain-containing protein [Roseovarius aestuarii]